MNRIAAIQMASGPNISANLDTAARHIANATAEGAGLIVLPENFALMGMTETEKVVLREAEGSGQIQDFLAQQAAKHGIWLVGGTIPLVATDPHKVRAACLVFDAKGRRVARYDKNHLFDVRLEEGRETYAESQTIEAGDHSAAVVDTPFGRLGLAVCYDLRFPEHFRGMLDADIELIALPSAFTAITGQAHWEILVRARAIENLCYVIAAAQGGYHVNGRRTHGDSMIVDPWGTVLKRMPQGTGVVTAELDRERLASTRRNFPALEHRRLYCEMKMPG